MSSDTPTQPGEPISLKKESDYRFRGDQDSARNFRREIERESRDEMRVLRESNDEKSLEIERLKSRVNTIEMEFHTYRENNKETLKSAQKIVSAGLVIRGMLMMVVALVAMIGGIPATWETLKGWFLK